MLGSRKKEIELLKKRNEALKAEKEALNQIIDKADEEHREMQLKVWKLESELAQARLDGRQMDQKLRSELWQQVHKALTGKATENSIRTENCCRCFNDPSGVWKVVTVEGSELASLRSAEDAYCYSVLYQIFKMRPEARASMEGYLERFRKSA